MKMQAVLLCATILWLATNWAVAQQWIRTLDGGTQGNDEVLAVVTTLDNDVVVTGLIDLGTHQCGALAKYSAGGEQEWLTIYDPFPGYTSRVSHVVATASGELYAAAACKDSSDVQTMAVLKLSADGTLLREFRYSHSDHLRDYPCGLLLDGRGDLLVLCCSKTSATQNDVLVVKCDTACLPIWMTRYDLEGGLNGPLAMASDSAGNAYVVGYGITSTLTVGTVVKLTMDGDTSWTRVEGTPGEVTEFESVAISGDRIYAIGWRSFGRARALTVRYTGDGDTVWTRERVEGAPKAVVAVDTFGVIHTDAADDSSTSFDIRTFAYSHDGTLRWVSRYDGPAHRYDSPTAVAADPERDAVYVVGYSHGVGTGWDCTTISYDFAGDLRWLHRYASVGGSGHDVGQAMAMDGAGSVIVAGYETGTQSGKDWLLIKYPPSGPAVEEPGMPQAATHDAIVVRPSVVSSRCGFNIRKPEAQSGIRIHDISGRTVRRLALPSGETSVTWNATDESGRPVGNGVYFAVMESSALHAAAKFLVQR